MPEIVQDIGAYAGLASVLGLAVLSVLYFSQARDVKRLREWAGRAPERATDLSQPITAARIAAQPQAKTPQPAQPARTQPVRPGAPAVPAAAGARPAASGAPAATAAAKGAKAPANAAAGQASPQSGNAAAGETAPAPAGAGAAGAQAGATAPAPAKPDTAPGEGGQAPGGGEGAPGLGSRPAAPSPAAPARPGQPAAPAQGSPSGASKAPAAPQTAAPATAAGGRPPGAAPAQSRTAPSRPVSQPTAVISPPREPWHQRLLGSTRNLVLAIAGVLVLGAGVAFALTQLSGEDSPATPSGQSGRPAAEEGDVGGDEQQAGNRGGRNRPAIDPAGVTVAVLNGTTVPGLAQKLGDEVTNMGFNLGTVANSQDDEGQQRAESVILYANGHERDALVVSRRLDITQREEIDPSTQGLAGDATVVVIAGADRSN